MASRIQPYGAPDVSSVNRSGKPSESTFGFMSSVERFMREAGRRWETAKAVIGSPSGGDMGPGSINSEAIFVNGKPPFLQEGNAEKGLVHTPKDHGTVTTGTVTIDPLDSIHHELVCDGAITIEPATTNYHGSAMLHITNGASAGTKTPDGFTFQDGGDPFTNTPGDKFKVIMYFFGADGCDYIVKRRQ